MKKVAKNNKANNEKILLKNNRAIFFYLRKMESKMMEPKMFRKLKISKTNLKIEKSCMRYWRKSIVTYLGTSRLSCITFEFSQIITINCIRQGHHHKSRKKQQNMPKMAQKCWIFQNILRKFLDDGNGNHFIFSNLSLFLFRDLKEKWIWKQIVVLWIGVFLNADF